MMNMLSDFERKLQQIIINDRITNRVTNLDDLEQQAGHHEQELVATVDKLKSIPAQKGRLG
jgi:hypothetical protein